MIDRCHVEPAIIRKSIVGAFAALLLLSSYAQSFAQVTERDSLARAATADAIMAARRQSSNAFIGGLGGGIAAGFAPLIISHDRQTAGIAVGVGGLSIIGVSLLVAGRSIEPPLSNIPADRRNDPTYMAEYRTSYAQQLARNRRKAVIWGAAIGSVVGLLFGLSEAFPST